MVTAPDATVTTEMAGGGGAALLASFLSPQAARVSDRAIASGKVRNTGFMASLFVSGTAPEIV
jgi:hypothetical protein